MKNKKLFAILTLVCFMMTLMPVAAFAAGSSATIDQSAFVAVKGDQSVKVNRPVEFYFSANDKAGVTTDGSLSFVVWAVDANGAVSSALDLYSDADCTVAVNSGKLNNTFAVEDATEGTKYYAKFARSGKYTVYAGVLSDTEANSVSGAQLVGGSKSNFSVITVNGAATDPEKTYRAYINEEGTDVAVVDNAVAPGKSDGETIATLKVTPNNVAETVTVKFNKLVLKNGEIDKDADPQKLTNANVTIDTNSANIDVSKTSATTNVLGEIKFDVSAAREGKYEIYLSVDGVEFVIAVDCSNTSAASIETVTEPKNPIALYEKLEGDVQFNITDINGNIFKPNTNKNSKNEVSYTIPAGQGVDGIRGYNPKDADETTDKYLIFTSKPSASNLENDDLYLEWNQDDQVYDLKTKTTLDAEGTYTVKAILDNGAYATATFEVKKFGTPVMIYIEVADQAELGKNLVPEAKYMDANKVTKKAKDAQIAANGYAISSLSDTSNGTAIITLKTDEKYAGTNIEVTAVSERYNLVATKTIKIAGEGTQVVFKDSSSLAVNANNKIDWFIADADGNAVKVDTGDWKDTRYVVLDKPEGAKVTVWNSKTFKNGEGQMALVSDTIGNVTVQVVVQAKLSSGTNNSTGITSEQTKYYTGTKIFAVGNGSVGDVVVMSIGSNEIIINDKKATIDAEPIIQNDRTYVPFRALTEAFGAEVAYDEATQAVTAELNGVTVVMTIGSATYTVNGAEKTMDVAPFINGSRTMVPVRFAAEAFGIKVIPTYNPDGSTADILFNL